MSYFLNALLYNDNSVTFLEYKYIQISLICLVTGNIIMVTHTNQWCEQKKLKITKTDSTIEDKLL